MRIESAKLSHVGLVRENNEDVAYANDALRIYAVADGMGGHEAGEVAAETAIGQVCRVTQPTPAALVEAFSRAHEAILHGMKVHPEMAGMGTTMSACVIEPRGEHVATLHIAHVGDSAIFALGLHRGRGERVTESHTVANANPGQKIDPYFGGALANCLGVSRDSYTGAQVRDVRLVEGDVVVLASDGLTRYMSDPKEIATMIEGLSAQAACERLVQHALGCGGVDNVTVVVVKVLP